MPKSTTDVALPVLQQAINEQFLQRQVLETFIKNYKKDGTKDKRRTKTYYEKRLEVFQRHWDKFEEGHRAVMRIILSECENSEPEHDYFTEDMYGEMESFFICNYSSINERYKEEYVDPDRSRNQDDSMQINNTIRINGGSSIKLPRIELEKFDGNYDKWPTFHDLFRTMVHQNESLSAVQKIQYLKLHLSGEPEQLLRHFNITEKNYEAAWNLLQSRYDNKRVLVNTQLKNLLGQSSARVETAEAIRKLMDTTSESLQALTNLDVDVTSWDPIVVYLLVQKLPPESHQLWEQEASKKKELPSWRGLKEFLEMRFRTLEAVGARGSTVRDGRRVNTSAHSFHASESAGSICSMCQGQHSIRKCIKFMSLGPNGRIEMVRDKKLCWNCLSSGHVSSQCPSVHRCYHCQKPHHTLLHLKLIGSTQRNPHTNPNNHHTETPSSNSVLNVNSSTFQPSEAVPGVDISSYIVKQSCMSQVLLATALIRVVGPSGRQCTVRALIDQGSQVSFLTERVVQSLKLQKEFVNATVQGIGNEHNHQINARASCIVKSTINEDEVRIDALVMRTLTRVLPTSAIVNRDWSHISGLQLADPQFYQPGHVDVLLGADVFGRIIMAGLIKGADDTPVAQKTIFGWILSGEIPQTQPNKIVVKNFHLRATLEEQLRSFWEVEELKHGQMYTEEEKKCEDHYRATTTRRQNGQYEVELPFTEVTKQNYLGKSRQIAIKRLYQLEHRFKLNPKLREEYVKCMKEYLSLGHMKEVNANEMAAFDDTAEVVHYKSSYLPHHGIIKETSTTTKLRVVFDASRTTESGRSLNEMLLKGPTIQDELPAILLRWRKHRVAFTADIEKMYRQVWVKNPYPAYQRIVWRESGAEPIKDYELLTVTFGTKSAPYLAIKTLNQLATDESNQYPLAAEITINDFYVDDLLSGADNLETALEAQRQLMSLTRAGGLPLRKWMANKKELLNALPNEEHQIQLPSPAEDECIKTLGICWNPTSDTCVYSVNLDESPVNWTKRSILSQIAKLFDPLGWLAPTIVIAKVFMQKLWLSGLGWDDEVSPALKVEWSTYFQELSLIRDVQINRWINFAESDSAIEIHGFADASMKAYAAVVYICTTNSQGIRSANIVMAKTKVAPIKTISLPRLELCAAALAAKVIKYVIKSLKLKQSIKIFAWSDSEIVLAWLKNHPTRWTTFVANRVSHIHELLGQNVWRHVPSKQNPADCASRGTGPAELRQYDLWWHGPDWLEKPSSSWPNKPEVGTELERRKGYVNHVQVAEEFEFHISTYTKLIRIVAYCYRFIQNARKKPERREQSYLKASETRNAVMILIRRTQSRHFATEINALKTQKVINTRSTLLNLYPFLDQNNVLRVGGRLKNSSLSYDQKHPIILPSQDHFTGLLIAKIHRETLHGGVQLMMTVLRNKYWLVNARNAIKHHIHKCVPCFRQKATVGEQLMGDLPSSRVNMARPFSHAGLDYCGPFELKTHKGRGAKKYKAYVSLFVCMSVKAIHLELVTELSADAFIAALRRFCSRRGLCTDIYCDNGTNFTGASKNLSKQHKKMMENLNIEIAELVEDQGINFHFIPPSAPHFGGLWEAGVKSTKSHLKRVLGNNTFTYEEFSTVLCQIEACLNSRPLCPMNADVEDLTPLTPAHFLIGDVMLAPPQEQVLDLNIHRLDRWQHLQHVTQGFWKRWNSEYLCRLQQRPKWTQKGNGVQVGDLVILKDENVPPSKWILARILETHPGSDGLTRVVTVRTQNSVLKRPITKICLLPIENRDVPPVIRSANEWSRNSKTNL